MFNLLKSVPTFFHSTGGEGWCYSDWKAILQLPSKTRDVMFKTHLHIDLVAVPDRSLSFVVTVASRDGKENMSSISHKSGLASDGSGSHSWNLQDHIHLVASQLCTNSEVKIQNSGWGAAVLSNWLLLVSQQAALNSKGHTLSNSKLADDLWSYMGSHIIQEMQPSVKPPHLVDTNSSDSAGGRALLNLRPYTFTANSFRRIAITFRHDHDKWRTTTLLAKVIGCHKYTVKK